MNKISKFYKVCKIKKKNQSTELNKSSKTDKSKNVKQSEIYKFDKLGIISNVSILNENLSELRLNLGNSSKFDNTSKFTKIPEKGKRNSNEIIQKLVKWKKPFETDDFFECTKNL